MNREHDILEAAAALFYDRGFNGVGIDEIGERVGVSGPALYRHFSGKDEILARLFSDTLDELMAISARVYRDDPERELSRLITHHVAFTLERRERISVYQREERSLSGPWHTEFRSRQREYVTRWRTAIAACYPAAGPDAIAVASAAATGMIYSAAHWTTETRAAPHVEESLARQVLLSLSALGAASQPGSVAASATGSR